MSKLELRKEILSLKEQGLSPSEIAIAVSLPDYEVEIIIERFGHKILKEKGMSSKSRELSKNVFELKAQGTSVTDIARQLSIDEVLVQEVIENDQKKIKHKPLWENYLHDYRNGDTLQTIGDRYGVTRERIRQSIERQMYVENGYGPVESTFHKAEIKMQIRTIVNSSFSDRSEELTLNRIAEAKNKGIEPQYFDSVHGYVAAVGIDNDKLKKFAPNLYEIVRNNSQLAAQKWHKYYSECRMCHTTNYKYQGRGYCENCYTKSPEWKESQKRSHLKRKDVITKRSREYMKEYSQRPHVKARLEKYMDKKYFGGNRHLALERDNFVCIKCGKTMDEKDRSGKPIVKVWHLNGDLQDHQLENLGTYCLSCYTKHVRRVPLNPYTRDRE